MILDFELFYFGGVPSTTATNEDSYQDGNKGHACDGNKDYHWNAKFFLNLFQ